MADSTDMLLPRNRYGTLQPDAVLQERYCILDVLGVGGMGAVYEARDLRFPNVERKVAVKEMKPPMPDPKLRAIVVRSFEREADNLASLDHPAIPKIYDYFVIRNRVYLVMEYIQGRNLETTLIKTHGFIKTETVHRWAIALCDVLHYLHSHKPDPIVFRDVKPANIMIDQHSNLRLIDFGIAKTFEMGHDGTMIGSVGYAPPEQYRGEATPSGDIYALGATLHFLLTKCDPRQEKPFTFNLRPIRDYNPTVSESFTEVITRALAYEPEERYVDAALMKAALERINPVHGEVAPKPSTPDITPPIEPIKTKDIDDTHRSELKLVLKRSPLLRALMRADPELMMAALKEESYPANTVLFRQGDPGDRVYAIWSGRLRAQHDMGGGRPPIVVGDRGPGDLMGEMSLLEDKPRSATVIVVEDARLISLSRESFQRLLGEPELTLAVLCALSQRLRGTDEQLVEAARSVDFLARRLGDTSSLEAERWTGSTPNVSTQQWERLSTLFQAFEDATDDIMNGLNLLRIELPDDINDEVGDLLSLLGGQTRRMARQLRRIRDWQKLEGRTAQIAQDEVDMGAIAAMVTERLTPSAHILNLRFALEVEPDIPVIKGDTAWLRRALTEVVKNALQYAPPESCIKVAVKAIAHNEVRLCVTDAGRGVPPRYQELIFDPFVRAPNAEGNGMGLGLTLCRAAVEAHGGRIYVNDRPSAEGQGSVFTIDLPTLPDFGTAVI